MWLVELAPLAHAELVPSAIASTIGVQEGPTRTLLDGVVHHLQGRRLVLLLDNCEHLIDACAQVVDHLLSKCPDMRILATSREPLRIAGEQLWRVSSLVYPSADRLQTVADLAQLSAVQLFVERARAVQPQFRLTPANAPSVAHICARLDGLPLALELTAARLRGLTVDQLASRLQQSFAIASGGSPTAPTRHQTLRATLDWSHALLGSAEASLFRRLAVFGGQFTVEAVESVCVGDGVAQAAALDLLLQLVDRSLVNAEERGNQAVYRFPDAVHDYALDRLRDSGEMDALQRRYLEHYLMLATSADMESFNRQTFSVGWLVRLEQELDNLRGSLAWTHAAGETEAGLRLAGALWLFWRVKGRFAEGLHWLVPLLRRTDPVPNLERARALLAAGNLEWARGHAERGLAWLEEALVLFRRVSHAPGVAVALINLADVEVERQNYTAAQNLLEEALSIADSESPMGTVGSLHDLGEVSLYQGKLAAAREYFERCLEAARAENDDYFVGRAMRGLGRIAGLNGDAHQATMMARGAIGLQRALGAKREIAECLELLAAAAMIERHLEQATRLFASADAIWESIGAPRPVPDQLAHEQELLRLRTSLGDRQFDVAWSGGHGLGFDEAIEEALDATESEPVKVANPLTAREREVASLVARGLTNRQIAESLVIAEGTADRHLSNILAKLELRSRAALAAWAVEHVRV